MQWRQGWLHLEELRRGCQSNSGCSWGGLGDSSDIQEACQGLRYGGSCCGWLGCAGNSRSTCVMGDCCKSTCAESASGARDWSMSCWEGNSWAKDGCSETTVVGTARSSAIMARAVLVVQLQWAQLGRECCGMTGFAGGSWGPGACAACGFSRAVEAYAQFNGTGILFGENLNIFTILISLVLHICVELSSYQVSINLSSWLSEWLTVAVTWS